MKTYQLILTSIALASVATAQEITVTPSASQKPVTAPAENFTGKASVDWRFSADDPARVSGGMVRFEAGARTAWHKHPLGQTLIVTEGAGRVQMWEGAIQEIKKGDIVRIPPDVKHWHGASPGSAMSHIAISEHVAGKTVEWMENVSDADFNARLPGPPAPATEIGPSRAQQLMGDIAPKLAQLTDDVLFGEVWSRTEELSSRDRSLATISALIAMNRPDQLRSHIALGRTNGLTKKEISEVITHLSFYSGWPNGVTAVGVAREVFEKE